MERFGRGGFCHEYLIEMQGTATRLAGEIHDRVIWPGIIKSHASRARDAARTVSLRYYASTDRIWSGVRRDDFGRLVNVPAYGVATTIESPALTPAEKERGNK